MNDELTTSSVATVALIKLMLEKGVKPVEIIEKTGLPRIPGPDEPDISVPLGSLVKLWKMAVEKTGDRAIGLHLINTYGNQLKHFVAHIALSSNNVREGLEYWCRYAPLVCATDRIEIRTTEKTCIVRYENLAPEYENIWMHEHYLAMGLYYARQYGGPDISPIEVHCRHADPGYADEYRRVLNSPVYFEQPESHVVFPRAFLEQKLESPKPYIQKFMSKTAEALLSRVMARESVAARVKKRLAAGIAKNAFQLDYIARAENLEVRTLHRKLKKEGTSYSDLLEDTRRTLADAYLKQGLKINEITYLLGFSEPSAFQRAFRRWYGISPGKYSRAVEKTGS